MAVYSIGMFIGGFVFGKLSDKYGRKSMLIITSIFNVLGYLTVIFAPIWGLFLIFVAGRFIAGLAYVPIHESPLCKIVRFYFQHLI